MRPDFTALDDPMKCLLMDLRTGQKYMVRRWLGQVFHEMYTDLLTVAKQIFMFAGEGVVAAPLVAEKLGMRWGSSAVAPMSFFSAYDPPVFGSFPIFAKLSKAWS